MWERETASPTNFGPVPPPSQVHPRPFCAPPPLLAAPTRPFPISATPNPSFASSLAFLLSPPKHSQEHRRREPSSSIKPSPNSQQPPSSCSLAQLSEASRPPSEYVSLGLAVVPVGPNFSRRTASNGYAQTGLDGAQCSASSNAFVTHCPGSIMLTFSLSRAWHPHSRSCKQAFSTTRQSQLAKMTLIGRLGAQPQTAQDKQGRDIMIYSVATNDRAAPNADGSESGPQRRKRLRERTGRESCLLRATELTDRENGPQPNPSSSPSLRNPMQHAASLPRHGTVSSHTTPLARTTSRAFRAGECVVFLPRERESFRVFPSGPRTTRAHLLSSVPAPPFARVFVSSRNNHPKRPQHPRPHRG